MPSARLAVAGLLPVAAGPRCRQRDRMDVPMDWVSGSTSAWLQWSPLDWVSGSTSAWLVPSRVTAAVGCSASAVARVCTCVEGGTWSSVALRAPPSTTVQWSPAQLDATVGCHGWMLCLTAVARVCTRVHVRRKPPVVTRAVGCRGWMLCLGSCTRVHVRRSRLSVERRIEGPAALWFLRLMPRLDAL